MIRFLVGIFFGVAAGYLVLETDLKNDVESAVKRQCKHIIRR